MASKVEKDGNRRTFLPPPEIPLKNEYDEIDIDALAGQDLQTFIKGDHINPGDTVYPIWRALDPAGMPFDVLGSAYDVAPGYDPDIGLSVPIANRFLVSAKGGWAFYSYKLNGFDDATPDSRRVFCYLGRRDRGVSEGLSVVQARESHDRVIVWDELETEGVLFMAPPYQAMQVGDSVELVIRRFDATGTERSPVTERYDISASDIGQPLRWQVRKASFTPIREGHADIHYEVALTGRLDVLLSPVQSVQVARAPSPTDYLPEVRIDGHAGDPIDPGRFPDGLTVRVPAYPDMQVGDQLLLYWEGPTSFEPQVRTARMDVSSLQVEDITFGIEAQLLEAGEHRVSYQFARAGAALSSKVMVLQVEAPRMLVVPRIEQALEDGPGRQMLEAAKAITGAYVSVPDFELRPGEKIEVHWQGYRNGGQQVTAIPESPDTRRYRIDPAVVAANMHQPRDPEGRRFQVFYRIVGEDGTPLQDSPSVDLRIAPLAPNPTIACREADSNGELRNSRLTANGALLLITGAGLWPFAAEGQLLTISIDDVEGGVLRDAKPITVGEVSGARVEQWLSRTVYGRMADGVQHTVRGQVSFDQGDSWHATPLLRLTPRKSL